MIQNRKTAEINYYKNNNSKQKQKRAKNPNTDHATIENEKKRISTFERLTAIRKPIEANERKVHRVWVCIEWKAKPHQASCSPQLKSKRIPKKSKQKRNERSKKYTGYQHSSTFSFPFSRDIPRLISWTQIVGGTICIRHWKPLSCLWHSRVRRRTVWNDEKHCVKQQQRYQRHHETRGAFGSRFSNESAAAEKGRTIAQQRSAAKFQRLIGEPASVTLS